MHARLRPPLQWKGGMICELYKKGESSILQNYADDSGKSAGKLVRTNFMQIALGS